MKTFRFNNLKDVQAFRISPDSTNYFAILCDSTLDGIENIFVVEIFNAGGATPPTNMPPPMSFSMYCMAKAWRAVMMTSW